MKKRKRDIYLYAAKTVLDGYRDDLEQNFALYSHGLSQVDGLGEKKPSLRKDIQSMEDAFLSDVEGILNQFLHVYQNTPAGNEMRPAPVPAVSRVLVNGPAIILFWEDGTKTVAVCSEEDTYSFDIGLLIAVLKKIAPEALRTAVSIVRTLSGTDSENQCEA